MVQKILIVFFIIISQLYLLSNTFADNTGPLDNQFSHQDFTDSDFDEGDTFPEIDSDIKLKTADNQDKSKFLPGLSINGFLKFETEYGYERSSKKLSKARINLFLESNYKIDNNWTFKLSGNGYYDFAYRIESRKKFARETLDDNEYDISFKELYIDGKLNAHYSIKAGKQVIVFGESDYARVLDIANPRDLTQPGLISIEDARIPVNLIRFSGNFDQYNFDFVNIYEHPGSRISGKGSDFDYYAGLRDPGIFILSEDKPESGFMSSGLGFKITKIFNGGDISLVAADTYNDQPYLTINDINGSGIFLKPRYDKYKTYGISGNLAKGSTLFKFETGFQHNIKLMRNDILTQIKSGISKSLINTTMETNRLDIVTGIEYTGVTDLRINVEAQVIHILDYQTCLNDDKNIYRAYLQATYNMLNNTLKFDAFWVYFYPGNGNILRLKTNYDLSDGLSIEAGVIFYNSQNTASPIYYYNNQDRIFFNMKYSF